MADPERRTSRTIRFIELNWGILLILIAWEAWVVINDFNPIVMPTPQGVALDLIGNPGIYLENTAATFFIALVGLIGGMLIGTSLAILTWFSPVLSGLVSPTAVLFSSVPVVSLIPIIARMLGYNMATEIAIVVIITFFPSFVFTTSGLRALPPGSQDLFSVLGASKLSTLRRLALPAAIPNLAIALRLAAAHAILAAMIAEFLMGTNGLGYLFAVTKQEFLTERAFGTSVVATVISVIAFLATSYLERRVRARFT
ncbi:MAG: ABC transporter permease subunit [Rhodospirillaceae bacterium]|jgi:NitT/TauT family transport system permease protein|nr:ABC transporter permease subunit [Rhodospirillaceae bacterium]MBT5458466.1 ABC transporter permease subunit [Rhodospirillaceae bacterium]